MADKDYYAILGVDKNASDEEIDKAVKDAEAHASEDKKRKEEIETRNNAESLVYNSQKTLDELGDKISAEEKSKVEAEIANVNKALEGKDVEEIKKATESLTQVFYSISSKLYQNAQNAQNAANNSANGTTDNNGTTTTTAEEENTENK